MTDEKDLIRERKKKLENISEFSLTYPNKVIKSDTTRSLINTQRNRYTLDRGRPKLTQATRVYILNNIPGHME